MMEDPHSPRAHNGDVWTFTSLREYLLRVVSDLSAKQSQLADAQDKAVQAALVAQEKAVQAALAAADKAVQKAEEGAYQWRSSANEWRGAMSDRERSFLQKEAFDAGLKTINEKIDALASSLNDKILRIENGYAVMIGKQTGHSEVWAYVVAALGIIIGGVGLAVVLIH